MGGTYPHSRCSATCPIHGVSAAGVGASVGSGAGVSAALLAGAAIGFFQSIENFNVTLFTRGTSNTLTVYVFSKVRSGITPTIV